MLCKAITQFFEMVFHLRYSVNFFLSHSNQVFVKGVYRDSSEDSPIESLEKLPKLFPKNVKSEFDMHDELKRMDVHAIGNDTLALVVYNSATMEKLKVFLGHLIVGGASRDISLEPHSAVLQFPNKESQPWKYVTIDRNSAAEFLKFKGFDVKKIEKASFNRLTFSTPARSNSRKRESASSPVAAAPEKKATTANNESKVEVEINGVAYMIDRDMASMIKNRGTEAGSVGAVGPVTPKAVLPVTPKAVSVKEETKPVPMFGISTPDKVQPTLTREDRKKIFSWRHLNACTDNKNGYIKPEDYLLCNCAFFLAENDAQRGWIDTQG